MNFNNSDKYIYFSQNTNDINKTVDFNQYIILDKSHLPDETILNDKIIIYNNHLLQLYKKYTKLKDT